MVIITTNVNFVIWNLIWPHKNICKYGFVVTNHNSSYSLLQIVETSIKQTINQSKFFVNGKKKFLWKNFKIKQEGKY